MVSIAVIPFGYLQAARNFERMGEDMMRLEGVLEMIGSDMMRVTAANFDAQGRRGGGAWAKISTAWTKRKLKMGGDPRIQHFRHELRESVTVPGAPFQIFDINRHEGTVRIGSTLPYAKTAQKHRPYLKFTKADNVRWGKWVTGDVRDKWARRARQR